VRASTQTVQENETAAKERMHAGCMKPRRKHGPREEERKRGREEERKRGREEE